MANEEYRARLRQGVKVWNPWRIAHSQIGFDLSGADLEQADLKGALLYLPISKGQTCAELT